MGVLGKIKRTLVGDKQRIRSLEINLTAHCNLKCYGCGRGSPALAEEFLSLAELADDLKVLTKAIHAREFKLAGGEPLLHPELLTVIDMLRSSGVTDRITLITNGVLLHEADESLWEKIDEIWVSAYPGVRRRFTHDDILRMGKKHHVKIEYNYMNAFTQRLLNTANDDDELVQEIYTNCYQRSGCHSIYGGKIFQCATGPFIPKWLEEVGAPAEDFSNDGISLHGPGNLRKQIKEYLARDEPLAACRYCMGGIGKPFENHQLNKAGVKEWLTEEHTDVHALIDMQKLADVRGLSNAETYDKYGERIELPPDA